MTDFGVTPTGTNIIVDPYYGSFEKYGSLFIPGANANPISQMGKVMAVGLGQREIEVGDIVAYRVMCGEIFRWKDYEYLVYKDYDVVGFMTEDGQLWPRKNHVMVKPIWTPREEKLKSGIIKLNRFEDRPPPPMFGHIMKVGADVKHLKTKLKVAIPHVGGYEMGVGGTVYYLIHEQDIPGWIEE